MHELGHYQEGFLLPTQAPTMHLVMTTRLLSLNTAELQEVLQAELAENPALELVEERRCPQCGRLLSRLPCPYCQDSLSSVEVYELPQYTGASYRDADDSDDDWYAFEAAPVSLAEYAWRQLAPDLAEAERAIGRALVERLDEHGLLSEHPAEIAAYLNCPLHEVLAVLHKLHQVEPVGVGATDIQECLLIQLRHLQELGQGHDTALRLVAEAWDALCRANFDEAAAALDCEEGDILEAVAFIQDNTYPRPADTHWSSARHPERPPERLREPDIMIYKEEDPDRLVVEIYAPSPTWLRVNPEYRELARAARAAANGDGPPAWARLADEAELFIKSLAQRNQTMRVIMNRLVEAQREFILMGDRFLKPMTRAELAIEVGVHESTVSRAVSRKNVALPNGRVVPLSIFFDRSLSVRDQVKEIIENECADAPLSDGQIAALLSEQGVEVARRTVAKYRTTLGILPAQLRHKHSTAA
ncbi:MAG: RNA polymerase factor sigma-54 [Anaerolineae bacterium]